MRVHEDWRYNVQVVASCPRQQECDGSEEQTPTVGRDLTDPSCTDGMYCVNEEDAPAADDSSSQTAQATAPDHATAMSETAESETAMSETAMAEAAMAETAMAETAAGTVETQTTRSVRSDRSGDCSGCATTESTSQPPLVVVAAMTMIVMRRRRRAP